MCVFCVEATGGKFDFFRLKHNHIPTKFAWPLNVGALRGLWPTNGSVPHVDTDFARWPCNRFCAQKGIDVV